MTFTREGDKVTLEVSVNDWETLLLMLRYAVGALYRDGGNETVYVWMRFVNELNRMNPNFLPYEIPAEFRDVK